MLTFEHVFALAIEDDCSCLEILVAQKLGDCESFWFGLDRLSDIELLCSLLWLTWLTLRLTGLLLLLHLLLLHHLCARLCLSSLYIFLRGDTKFCGLFFNRLLLESLKLFKCHATFFCFGLHQL